MNIVKFNDTELTDDNRPIGVTDAEIALYNKYFRGRWCWAIRMDDVFLIRPDDDLKGTIPGIVPEDYTLLERYGVEEMRTREDELDNPIPLTDAGEVFSLKLVKFMSWVSKMDSPAYMNTDYFTYQNSLLDGAGDLSMCLVRRYRAQVAAILYNGVQNMALDFCDKKQAMLEYYIYDMTDQVTSTVGMFRKGVASQATACSCGCGGSHGSVSGAATTGVIMNTLTQLGQAGCGCGSSLISAQDILQTVSTCDIIAEYRRLIKMYMVSTFGDLDFWKYVTTRYKIAIERIIKYTQAVIDTGLSIFTSNRSLDLNYGCAQAGNDRQKLYDGFVYDLKNIITAFELIKDEDYTRLSFIRSNLLKFTDYYEYMQWNDSNVMVNPGIDDRWIDVK